MAHARVATAVLVAIVAVGATARAQPCASCCCDKTDLTPPPPPPDPAADPEAVSDETLHSLLAAGAAVTISSYVLAVLIARGQPHSDLAVDTIPVVGALASAVRNGSNQNASSMLAFLGAAQGMGLLVVSSALTDLVARRRVLVDVSAGPNGCGARVTWRIP